MPEDLLSKLAVLPGRFPPEEPYLVGCSGGRDSTVLVDLLVRLGYPRLTLCHLNHLLRADAAEEDAKFVEALAASHRLESEVATVDVRACAERDGTSLETAGRHARRAFFAEIAAHRPSAGIFLAHHADDQIETVLMNLFRGAGTRGLAGMSEEALLEQPEAGHASSLPSNVGHPPDLPPDPKSADRLRIIRPLLGCWRSELDAYARAHRLAWRQDASNDSLDPLRNRIRHQLLPALEEIFRRDVRGAVWRAAELAAAENSLLSALAADALERMQTDEGLPLHDLAAQPLALRRRILHQWLARAGIPVTFQHIEAVLTITDPHHQPARVNLSHGWRARRRQRHLSLDRQNTES